MDKETGCVYISRHVAFNEDYFPFAQSTPLPKSVEQPSFSSIDKWIQ